MTTREQFLERTREGTEWWQVAWDADGVVGQVRTRLVPGEAERRGRRIDIPISGVRDAAQPR